MTSVDCFHCLCEQRKFAVLQHFCHVLFYFHKQILFFFYMKSSLLLFSWKSVISLRSGTTEEGCLVLGGHWSYILYRKTTAHTKHHLVLGQPLTTSTATVTQTTTKLTYTILINLHGSIKQLGHSLDFQMVSMATVHTLPVQVGLEIFSDVLREELNVLGLHIKTS